MRVKIFDAQHKNFSRSDFNEEIFFKLDCDCETSAGNEAAADVGGIVAANGFTTLDTSPLHEKRRTNSQEHCRCID